MANSGFGAPKFEATYKAERAVSRVASPVQFNGKTEAVPGLGAEHIAEKVTFSRSVMPAVAAIVQNTWVVFATVAAVSFGEFLAYRNVDGFVAALSAAMTAIFVVASLCASRLNRAALLGGLALYAISTTMMAVYAMTTETGIDLVLAAVILHCGLLFGLYGTYAAPPQDS